MEVRDFYKKNVAVGVLLTLMSVCPVVRAEEKSAVVEEINPSASLPPAVQEKAKPIEATRGEQSAAFGKTVTNTTVSGNKNVPVDSFKTIFRVREGMTLFEDNVNQDLQMMYETGWFYDVSAEYFFVPEGVRVNYKVEENPVLTKAEITGCSVYSDNLLKRLLGLEEGEVINSKRLSEGMRAIEAAYNRDGYILARVNGVDMQPDGLLKLMVNEGIIEGFSIKGNKKTKDRVILREMRLYEKEPFNVNEGRRSMQRIFNLGFFEDVNIKLNPGRTPNGVEVEIAVEEKPTGTFGVGAGYSEADGFVGMIMIGDKNLRGTGDSINLNWEFGGADNKNYDLSYHHPWLDNKGTSIGFNLYDVTHEYEELNDDGNKLDYYDRKRKGIEVFLSRPVNDQITDSIAFKFRKDLYAGDVSGDTTNWYNGRDDGNGGTLDPDLASARRKDAFGSTHSITLSRALDTRDNIYNPSSGHYVQFSGEFAGLMGGDFDFNKYILEGRSYHSVGASNVLAFRGVLGYATGQMPISQRFALGGDSYLRGYKDDRFRGYKMLSATGEYRFPIAKNFQGVAFTDAGYAWEKGGKVKLDDVEYGYGIGMRINSPLGPIRIDYAHGDSWRFHFSFGTQF